MNGAEQMGPDSEEILYDAVHGCEPLKMGSRLVTSTLSLAQQIGPTK